MDANGLAAATALGAAEEEKTDLTPAEEENEDEVVVLEEEGELQEEVKQMIEMVEEEMNRVLQTRTVEDQSVQTDVLTLDQSMNTDPDWELRLSSMLESVSVLQKEYDALRRRQEEEEEAHGKHKQQLNKKKEEAIKHHQVLLDKLESLRVKLQLNNSKATRKNFTAKKQEMTSEKSRVEDETKRLAKELEESDRKLAELTEEQQEEQRKWKEELNALRAEMEKARKEAQEAELQALKDEIAAVEKQRGVATAQIEAWLSEVGVYLNALRVEFPHKYRQERPQWEKKEAVVRRSQADLQNRFQEVLQQLQQGRNFQSLPRISVPTLPPVPMADLTFSRVMLSAVRPVFVPPPQPMPTLRLGPPPPQRYPNYYPVSPQPRLRYHPPPPHLYQHPPQPAFQPPHPAHIRVPVRVTPPPSLSPSPPVLPATPPAAIATSAPPSVPPPAGKLDKFLEKLGTHFPQCTSDELKLLLRQVKGARGTLAGMSMDEVVEQVGVVLMNRERPAPGPIQRPMSAGGGVARKPCLMCQNPVDPENRHPLSCTHTIHRDCIRVWIQSSKNNSCPFCPTK